MKHLFLSLSMLLGLCFVPPVFSEQQPLTGDAELTGLLANIKGNKAKFNEYRDIHDGFNERIKLVYDTDAWFLKADTKDAGHKTQEYELDGGIWGIFKAGVFYHELPHNITFGAKNMFTGVGSGNLTLPVGVSPINSATWPSAFDFSTERRQTGGSLSIDLVKPFFFNVSAVTEKRTGIKPAGASIGSSLDPFVELPEPIDYRTDTLKVDAGYAKQPLMLDFYYLHSEFDNRNDALLFPNIFLPLIIPGLPATRDILTLPPDNTSYRFGSRGTVRLPLDSYFNFDLSRGVAESNGRLYDTLLIKPLQVFQGRVTSKYADFALTASPVSFVDGKLFFKYESDTDHSDHFQDIFFSNNIFFDYRQSRFGGEIGFRLPAHIYISAEYKEVNTNRNLNANTKDNIYSADLRWNGLDFITLRTGYEHLLRRSDLLAASNYATTNVTGSVNFDIAPKSRDSIKAAVDIYPADFINIGLGYKHKNTDFRESVVAFGLRNDHRHEFFSNADIQIGRIAMLFGYLDYELTKRNQDQSSGGTAAWNLREKEIIYGFGVGTDVFLIPKILTLRLQYDQIKSDGNADFTLSRAALGGLGVFGANNNSVDTGNWDDYAQRSFHVRLGYELTKNSVISIGYAYEKFTLRSIQFDGYPANFIAPNTPAANANGGFLSGAFTAENYTANVILASITYKFR